MNVYVRARSPWLSIPVAEFLTRRRTMDDVVSWTTRHANECTAFTDSAQSFQRSDPRAGHIVKEASPTTNSLSPRVFSTKSILL